MNKKPKSNQSVDANQEIPLPGYPIMEGLISTENFDEIRPSMNLAYSTLEDMYKSKEGGLARQKQIRSVLDVYDLTFDLIKFLLQSKRDLIQQQQDLKKNK